MSEKLKAAPFFGCMISAKYPHFEAAVRYSLPKLGFELIDLEGFTCCPDPIYFQASDKLTWLSLAARNIAIAEEAGLDIMTCCSGCTSSLAETNYLLKNDDELRERVNKHLKRIGKEFKGTIRVRHIATVLRDEIGYETVAKSITKPLTGLKVAFHYGCHLLKPHEIMNVDDPQHPTLLEELVKAVGAEPISHRQRILCCGKSCLNEDLAPKMMKDILESVESESPDCLCLICPTCFDQYDMGQLKMKKIFDRKFEIPVVYYFQLLALAQGADEKIVRFQWHKIKPKEFMEKMNAIAGV